MNTTHTAQSPLSIRVPLALLAAVCTLTVSTLLTTFTLNAQDWSWQVLEPVRGTSALGLVTTPTGNIFLQSRTLLRSPNGGDFWLPANQGFPNIVNPSVAVQRLTTTLVPNGTGGLVTILLALVSTGSGPQVYVSNDEGFSWALPNGRAEMLPNVEFASFAAFGSHVFAGTRGLSFERVYRSTDLGQTWQVVQLGMPANAVAQCFLFRSMPLGVTLFMGTTQGLYRSLDTGKTWQAASLRLATDGTTLLNVLDLAQAGAVMLAATQRGIYRSTDNGATWQLSAVSEQVNSLAVTADRRAASGVMILAGSNAGVLRSENDGITWMPVSTGLPAMRPVTAVALQRGFAFAISDRLVHRTAMTIYTNVRQSSAVGGMIRSHVMPNPASEETVLTLTLLQPERMRCALYTMLGAEVFSTKETLLQAGTHHIPLPTTGLASGLYRCRVYAGQSATEPTMKPVAEHSVVITR